MLHGCAVNGTDLDFPNYLHLLLVFRLWELVDFDFVLLDFFHDLHVKKEREHGEAEKQEEKRGQLCRNINRQKEGLIHTRGEIYPFMKTNIQYPYTCSDSKLYNT